MHTSKCGVEVRRREIDARIPALERKILEMKEEIQALKTEWNAISPIGLLPREVLERIFVLYRDLSFFETPWRRLPWSGLMEVSRSWHNICRECPHLWAIVDFRNPPLAELMLVRSKNAPLILK